MLAPLMRFPLGSRATTALLFFVLLGGTPAHALSEVELAARIEVLASQVEALQAEVASLKAQAQLSRPEITPEVPPEARAARPEATPPAAPTGTAPSYAERGSGVAPDAEPGNVTWFGYGEVNYSRPSDDSENAVADVGRFILGAGYRFDDRTRFNSEVEIEHAVSSADDEGEVEIEQAYIEHAIGESTYAKIGLFLIPSGLLNEYHEPNRYYGAFRNLVETRIIPTTWREGGLAFQGNTLAGLRWDAGITTGFNLSKWDPASDEGLEDGPLDAIHQELSLARAADFSVFGALNYTGVPGLRIGGSVFTGDASQDRPGFDDNRVTLSEAHVRYAPGDWELSALYALGRISNTAEANLAQIPDDPFPGIPDDGVIIGVNHTPIPEEFFGWFVEGAYRGFTGERYGFTPFLRYEHFNTASEYADLEGVPLPAPDDIEAWTAGFTFDLAPGVVIKADYVAFPDDDEGDDRTELSLGYAF